MSLDRVRVLDAGDGPALEIVEHGGRAFAVVWPGVGAQQRSLHRILLEPAGATTLMTHPGDAVYYVVQGAGEVSGAGGSELDQLVEGSLIHIDGRTAYRFAAGPAGMELVGGPAPCDPALYRHLAAV
jgi:quercetin dioxygenase-like cupin family protein